jgi:hypothetical protein
LLETLAAPDPKPLSKKINFGNVSIILMTVFQPSTLKMITMDSNEYSMADWVNTGFWSHTCYLDMKNIWMGEL